MRLSAMATTARAIRQSAVLHGGTESPARGDGDNEDDGGEPATARCGRATLGSGPLGTAPARSVWRAPRRILADSQRRTSGSQCGVIVRNGRLGLSVSFWTSRRAVAGARAGPDGADGGTAGAAGDCSEKSESSTKPGSCAAAAAAEMPRELVHDGERRAPVGQTEPFILLFL